MLATIRAFCRRELDSLRVAYRHYRLERDRFARRTRVKHLSMAQEAMLAAVERQREETVSRTDHVSRPEFLQTFRVHKVTISATSDADEVEQHVRRLHEAALSIRHQQTKPHDAND